MLGTHETQAFLGRVAAVAEELGIGFPLQEDGLSIRELTFVNMLEDRYPLFGSEDNKASRALVQLLVGNSHELDLDDESVLERMEIFFGPIWHEDVGSGRHKFVDLVKQSQKILVGFK